MSKEEYAQFCYLLGKAKYELAKTLICLNDKKLRNKAKIQIKEIDDILKLCFIDGGI